MALQFESGVQNLVYQVDSGTGRRIIQGTLFILFAIAMAALYTFSTFQGLKDPLAMEEAQLACNVANGQGWSTKTIRPLSMWKVAGHTDGDARLEAHPDLLHPPVWPTLLAGMMKMLETSPSGERSAVYVLPRDYVPVVFNHFFVLLSALLIWLIGRKLFDVRVGTLSGIAFLISDVIWRQSTLGNDFSAAMCFVLASVYAALWAAELPRGWNPVESQGPLWRWLLPLMAASCFTALAFLTRYGAGCVLILLFFYFGVSRRRHSWAKACLYVGLVLLWILPWVVRNLHVSGQPFGLVGYEMLYGTYLFPGDALARSIHPVMPDAGAMVYAVQLKMVGNLRAFAAEGFGMGSAGILSGLFVAMYLHRFVRHASRTLRWCLVPTVVVLVLLASAFGPGSLSTLMVFWPLAIPYAWAFFLILLDRLQFEYRVFAVFSITLVMFLTGLPLLMNVLPPRTGLPYPPYYHGYASWVASMVEEEECLSTDIPWATAWYGAKRSILLPKDIDGFHEIDRKFIRIPLAYFTTVTRDKPWVRGLADPIAPEYSWYRVFSSGNVPGNFPLVHGRFIAGSDQMILADRARW
ncbi:MAG: glycosyltransferase family 39 protein [Verrucomicrobiota bacterium]|jgi:hypothetical protein|nr:glycosyltransferase family 39 protein [Verrucomicrobiota bacterium]